MDNKYFEEMWNKCDKEDLSEIQKLWDYRAEEFNKKKPQKDAQIDLDPVGFLLSKDALHKEFNVLDIGCGTGKHSVKLGEIAKSVTGIDISPTMIKYAEENAHNSKQDNVNFKCIPWQNVDINELEWNNKFDLAFASMSPAINSKEALIKMIKSSKKYCFMSGFVYRKDSVKDIISEKVLGKKIKSDYNNKIYYAFNILWNMGFYPEITIKDVSWTKKWNIEKAAADYTVLLKETVKSDVELQKKIRNCIYEIGEDGDFEETIEAKIGWLFWKI